MNKDLFFSISEQQSCTKSRLKKIGIIGVGQVGIAIAYSLVNQGIVDEIVLYDIDAERVRAEVMDLTHGLPFVKPCRIVEGSLDDLSDSQVLVMTAGAKQNVGENRLNLVHRNFKIIKGIIDLVLPKASDAIWLIVSNPVDVITYATLKLSGLPRSRVFGTGTLLDTARFRTLLSQRLKIDSRSVHAYIIGEHGDSEVPVWSRMNIAGEPIFLDGFEQNEIKLSESEFFYSIFQQVKMAAYEIIQRKGATSYAIGLAVAQIIQSIVDDQNRVLTLSTWVGDQYDLSDVCLSLPTVVNNNGISQILRISLSDNELLQLKRSAKILREVIDTLKL